jgi:hypothetical protein
VEIPCVKGAHFLVALTSVVLFSEHLYGPITQVGL